MSSYPITWTLFLVDEHQLNSAPAELSGVVGQVHERSVRKRLVPGKIPVGVGKIVILSCE